MARSILIVDDEANVSRVIRLSLERKGYQVSVACNGREALDVLARGGFDAMITDVMMPGMGGRELCRTLREELGEQELPIVVMTSRSEREERDWALAYPNMQLLEKPVSLRVLCELLEACFEKRSEVKEEDA